MMPSIIKQGLVENKELVCVNCDIVDSNNNCIICKPNQTVQNNKCIYDSCNDKNQYIDSTGTCITCEINQKIEQNNGLYSCANNCGSGKCGLDCNSDIYIRGRFIDDDRDKHKVQDVYILDTGTILGGLYGPYNGDYHLGVIGNTGDNEGLPEGSSFYIYSSNLTEKPTFTQFTNIKDFLLSNSTITLSPRPLYINSSLDYWHNNNNGSNVWDITNYYDDHHVRYFFTCE